MMYVYNPGRIICNGPDDRGNSLVKRKNKHISNIVGTYGTYIYHKNKCCKDIK